MCRMMCNCLLAHGLKPDFSEKNLHRDGFAQCTWAQSICGAGHIPYTIWQGIGKFFKFYSVSLSLCIQSMYICTHMHMDT